MEKHPYEELIETVADKMKEYEDDNLGIGIFEKVDKDLGLSRGTAWDASGWKDYCGFGFGDVWFLSFVRSSQYLKIEKKKFVSNGNELKKCMQQGKGGYLANQN